MLIHYKNMHKSFEKVKDPVTG